MHSARRRGRTDEAPNRVAYESHGLEAATQNPRSPQILNKASIIYRALTVWASHPLISQTNCGGGLDFESVEPARAGDITARRTPAAHC